MEWAWRVAIASGLAAILLGLWRWYARYLDNAIAKLYPSIVRYEQALGIRPEDSTLLDLRQKFGDSIDNIRKAVDDEVVGTRGHLPFDWFAVAVIFGMSACTLVAGNLTTLRWGSWHDQFHPYVMLLLNVFGALCVFWAMNAYQTDGKRLVRFRKQLNTRTDTGNVPAG